jgi:hypothetical protein
MCEYLLVYVVELYFVFAEMLFHNPNLKARCLYDACPILIVMFNISKLQVQTFHVFWENRKPRCISVGLLQRHLRSFAIPHVGYIAEASSRDCSISCLNG